MNIKHTLASAIDRLLNCPDLNLDELEDETIEAMKEAEKAIMSYNEVNKMTDPIEPYMKAIKRATQEEVNKMTDPIEPYLKAIKRATQENEHTYAVKLIAMYVARKHNELDGVYKLERCCDAISVLEDFYKHITSELKILRDDITASCFNLLNENEIKSFKEVL